MWKDFRSFILRGNVVDLAVGVVIGAAFGNIINSVVTGLINPLLSFASTGSLETKSFCVGTSVRGVCPHLFKYGQVLSAMLSFVIVAAVVFFLIVKPVNGLMERLKPAPPKDEQTRECPECLSKVPVRARRCSYCTSTLEPAGGGAT